MRPPAPLRASRRPARAPLCAWVATLGVAGSAALLLGAAPAGAWSPETQKAIARDAARLAPPDLARQLERHAGELAAGAVEPFSERDASLHLVDPDAGGRVDQALRGEVAAAIEAIREHRPFAEIARRLGRVSHWTADLDNPLNSSSADAHEPRYFRDFLLYADDARPRFAVVVYEWKPPLRAPADVERLLADGLERGLRLYPLLGGEYRRIGYQSGRARFDDRSTAFALASVAYSHAVTDAARLYRYIWIAAGGADPRPVFAHARDRVLILDQGGAP